VQATFVHGQLRVQSEMIPLSVEAQRT
jgi:hypothetical protein